MKIKTKEVSTEYALAVKNPKRKKPLKPNIFFRTLIRLLSVFDLMSANFSYVKKDLEKAGEDPYLILMNHSSFLDLKIASKILYKKPYSIICTSDGFVGKSLLMRLIGCIPAQKFVTDIPLVKDILYALKTKKQSVLMYPEASYSFDGTATPLPRRLGVFLKKLNVPVLTIITKGAFLREPLYNGLKKRKVKVSATFSCLLSKEEIAEKSVEELDNILDNAFSFDHFKTQQEEKIKVAEDFRAEGLERVLYRCSECEKEGYMNSSGTDIFCKNCGATHHLDEYGYLKNKNWETRFSHIPDWYKWQREQVKEEIKNGEYSLEVPVKIGILRDFKNIYMVGDGFLTHNINGFCLKSDDGKINYTESPLSSYSLYADYFWYEIDDVICIGNKSTLYYCFPKGEKDVVAKTRLATEELYKMLKSKPAIVK